MMWIYSIIGITVGVLLNIFVIEPIRRKNAIEECKRQGLIPWYFDEKDVDGKEKEVTQ